VIGPGGPEPIARHLVVRLSAEEAGVLKHVLAEVRQLLAGRSGAGRVEPDDPALARLLPDGYRSDPAASAELRELIEPDLLAGKIAQADVVIEQLGGAGEGPVDVRLDDEDAQAWLMTVNDARLALGTRLEVTEDMDYELEIEDAAGADPTSGRAAGLVVYHFLGVLQESLLAALIE
jgi:hypothetical protein